MVSNSIIYTFLFAMGLLLLIDTMHASVKVSNADHDDTILSLKKRAADDSNSFADEYPGFTFSKHRFGTRGARLPSESILLGKRRLPVEAVLLGRRNIHNADGLHNERR